MKIIIYILLLLAVVFFIGGIYLITIGIIFEGGFIIIINFASFGITLDSLQKISMK